MQQRGLLALLLLAAAAGFDCSGTVTTTSPTPDGGAGSGSSGGSSSSGVHPGQPSGPSSGSSSGVPSGSSSGSSSGAPSGSSSGASSGSSSGSVDASFRDGPVPTPDAFVSGEINAGTETGVNDVAACGMNSGITWQLGSPIAPKPSTALDGSSQNGGAVHVFCLVDPQGSGYAIHLSAELDGASSGTLTVTGTVDASGNGTGLTGSFATQGQNFQDNGDCTVTATYNGSPLPTGGAPAPGRIWGHIDCPHALENGQFGIGASGGQITRTCEGQADFLFENCQ